MANARVLVSSLALLACGTMCVHAGENYGILPTTLPYFGAEPWGEWRNNADKTRWEGGYVRASTGFAVSSVRKGPSFGGPTMEVETGKTWRDGQWVYGVGAGFGAMPVVNRFSGSSRFGLLTRDLEGGGHFKAGYLVRPDLLVYGRVGATGYSDTLRIGKFTDTTSGVAVEARAGAQWAVTDNLSVTVEVGVRQYR